MKPTLRQLQLFVAASEQKTFSAAAKIMCLTPSALSIQIQQLEDTMGIPLFEQIGKRKYLTSAGEELQASSRVIFDELQRVNMRLSQIKGGMSGELKISAVTSAKFFVPHLLGAFHKLYPNVRFKLTVANRNQILERIADNLDDLTIMAHVPSNSQVEAVPVLDNILCVIAPPSHRLAKLKKVTLADIQNEEFLFREQGSGTRMTTEQLFSKHGISVKSVMELGSSEAIKQAVVAGLGISIVSKHSAWLEIKTGYLTELNLTLFPEPKPWYSVHHEKKELSPIAEAFQDFIRDHAESIIRTMESLRYL